MSEIRKITVFKTSFEEVRIADEKTCKRVEKELKECVFQRLEKLDILLKNLNVCEIAEIGEIGVTDPPFCGVLFVNDKYETQEDFEQIAEAFGFCVMEADVPLRGKSYVIADRLAYRLGLTKEEKSKLYGNYNYKIPEETALALRGYLRDIAGAIQNETLENVVKTLVNGGITQHTITREIEEKHDRYGMTDLLLSSEEKGRSVTGYNNAEFARDVADIFEKQKTHMQNGVCGILESRAKQLGYKVTKSSAGDTVQYAFVRLQ